ncbi:MAG: carbohydrate ABC transporter permease, partial [Pseudomonadota bacterium]|nr:carbohydrate ABC transporter permease [Pseudomonadota bacterium]
MTQKSPLWLTVLSLSFLVLWLALASVPFIWTLWGSFKVEADFFSRLDWRNAIYGVRTLAETGGTFTGGGYEGAWVKEEFWKAA